MEIKNVHISIMIKSLYQSIIDFWYPPATTIIGDGTLTNSCKEVSNDELIICIDDMDQINDNLIVPLANPPVQTENSTLCVAVTERQRYRRNRRRNRSDMRATQKRIRNDYDNKFVKSDKLVPKQHFCTINQPKKS